MNHELATEKLAELAAGKLADEAAAPVQAHVDTCEDCRGALQTMVMMQGLGARGSILLEPHPEADQIVQFAAGELPAGELTEVAAHVRGCPECAVEHQMAMDSLTPPLTWAPLTWAERILNLFRAPGSTSLSMARIGTVALILLMAYPTFLGLRGDGQMQMPNSGAVLDQGTGTRLLYLPAPTRGREPLPTLPATTGLVPVAMEFDVALLNGDLNTELGFVLRDGDREVWSLRVPARRIYNPDLGVLSILIPDQVIPAGEYDLDLHRGTESRELATYPFRVTP